MRKIDVTKQPMPEINTAKVCFVIEKSRELLNEDVDIGSDASNPADDGERVTRMSGGSSLASQAPPRLTRLAANQLKRGKPHLAPQNGRSEGYPGNSGSARQVPFAPRPYSATVKASVPTTSSFIQGHLNWSPR